MKTTTSWEDATDMLTPFGVLLKSLNGNKPLAEKCVSDLLMYSLDIPCGNNQEIVIRVQDGFAWGTIDLWEDNGSVM